MTGTSGIVVLNPNPEYFAVYVTGTSPVTLAGSSLNLFYGVVYAPTSSVSITGGTNFFGAFVGSSMLAGGSAKLHFYTALRGN
ncbi:MAG: hypothetical protein HY271_15920 [Deltaproteobacteria bacterium]|nr:hypothetical protein [Deltaproteobacteria bacterium]